MFVPNYGFDPHNPHRGARGAMSMRFDEFYRCYPMVMAPGSERPELNYGSKILLPPSALDKVSRLHVQWPLLMELVNAEKGKHSHCGVLEFVAEEGRAYLPQWMMETLRLDVGDMIQIKTTSLELARMVKLQPQSPAFLEISDPKAVLERAFRNFASLTKGDIFNFEYNGDVYGVAVLEVKPESEKMGVSMLETDVSVEFEAPVGYVEPERVKGSGTGTPRNGLAPPGGVLHNQGTMAQAINYESIAPGTEALKASNFSGDGHRIGTKKGKAVATTSGKSSSTGTGTPKMAAEAALGTARRANGPMPLRLPPNKLFFGYNVRPVKTKEQKEEEAAGASNQPHFAGQGQSLRDAATKKKAGDDGTSKSKDKKPGKSSGRKPL
ncbi:ubiquitin fusion degradation protein [Grosmannia clavigera kw1407]|uniref:Ubiquitin fusion degradation protein n=1 Tax=Grosmannia clavigera (strain kw1407 / UAMH 11150) TaxID=655863 RepID=F0XTG0_GROCL|nr:ubiquitin fusion degradation protein [Grosmannia clavigera kw1407]EFW98609.1 ubiquitin fusion degradation protein [Grosmannia clavigera kw1407]